MHTIEKHLKITQHTLQKSIIMIASKMISNTIIPLRTSDTGVEALSIMKEFSITHLPIVNDKQLLGLLSEEDIINNIMEEPVGSYNLSVSRAYVKDTDHFYEVLRLLGEHKLTIIPVVDHESNYLGLITQENLLQSFAATGSFMEPGSIVVLEVAKRDYSLAEIGQIVESERAAILSSFVTTNLDNSVVDVTLKINKQEIQHIIASFERYNYKVKGTFFEDQYADSLMDRYDALMAYLNV